MAAEQLDLWGTSRPAAQYPEHAASADDPGQDGHEPDDHGHGHNQLAEEPDQRLAMHGRDRAARSP